MAWDETALPLVKANLNITQNVRDEYLTAIINGVVEQLQNEQGLALDEADPYHLQFVVDFSAWRYRGDQEFLCRIPGLPGDAAEILRKGQREVPYAFQD